MMTIFFNLEITQIDSGQTFVLAWNLVGMRMLDAILFLVLCITGHKNTKMMIKITRMNSIRKRVILLTFLMKSGLIWLWPKVSFPRLLWLQIVQIWALILKFCFKKLFWIFWSRYTENYCIMSNLLYGRELAQLVEQPSLTARRLSVKFVGTWVQNLFMPNSIS